jgi:predicted glycogen debranching enzyme
MEASPVIDVTRRLSWQGGRTASSDELVRREWLVTNGLGGYASGTIGGVLTRRYHGLLIAALPGPACRMVLLNHLTETLLLPDGKPISLAGEAQSATGGSLADGGALEEFRLEIGLPVWRFRAGPEALVEKRILMIHMQNTVHVRYRLLEGPGPLTLGLHPWIHFRPQHAPVGGCIDEHYQVHVDGDRYEISYQDVAPLRLRLVGKDAQFQLFGGENREFFYRDEADSGYESRGLLWKPGELRAVLAADRDVVLVGSSEPWSAVDVLSPEAAAAAETRRRRDLLHQAGPAAADRTGAELVLAADQFIISPAARDADAIRARAAGEDVRTVIAGYHWFTDWGRDAMISLEGLTLVTNRRREAAWILRTFASHLRDGLIPNLFPEGAREGLYHTADASLWFFEAVARFLHTGGNPALLDTVLPCLQEIVLRHLEGTHFGITVDPADGLLRQGEPGYQLTWMDAKVGDWVVTPRRGKAVEINALWYNALRLLAGFLRDRGRPGDAERMDGHAERARASFNRRFWYAGGGYLYDVVDGENGADSACRPNQVFALSLTHPVLQEDRWAPVIETVHQRLLTPLGLRSLCADHPDYRPRYFGDLRARDAAYHQGTVWAWLIGPFINAWLRVHTAPADRTAARQMLDEFTRHLSEAGMGTLSEIFDAEPPFTPRGCIAQAWSVAEVLRCWVATAQEPHQGS